MKCTHSIRLQFTKETGLSSAYIILFFVLYCGIIEICAHQNWFFNIVPYPSPSINSTFPELDVKFQRLWEYSNPNCLFLGSSMTDTGLHPAVFEDLINRNNNSNYRCFNMGFSSSMVEVSSVVANSIIKWQKTDLVIWGISPIDMDPNFITTRSIVNMPVFSYNDGDPTLLGFFFNHFRLPWFLSTLPHLQNGEYEWVLDDFNYSLDAQGMRRSDQINSVVTKQVMLPDFKINPDDMKAFNKSLNKFQDAGIKVIVVEMPVHPEFYPYIVTGGDEEYMEEFIIPIRDLLESKNIPFIRSQENISDIVDLKTCWGNESHLNTNGAIRFTQYLVHTIKEEGILP